MDTTDYTPIELLEAGYRALVEKLGIAGASRFMSLFERGAGDYTKERDGILQDVTMDQAIEQSREFYPKES